MDKVKEPEFTTDETTKIEVAIRKTIAEVERAKELMAKCGFRAKPATHSE